MLTRPDGACIWFDQHQPAPPGTAGAWAAPASGAAAPLLVLCPPGGRNAAYWPASWITELQDAGFEVLRFDWRDQGRSQLPAPVTPSRQHGTENGTSPGAQAAHVLPADVLAADVEALCASVLGESPVDDTGAGGPARRARSARRDLYLVGVGLGGWVAMWVARRRADRGLRPSRLVLVGTSGWYADPSLPGPTEPTVVSLVLRRRGSGPVDLLRAISREVAVELGGVAGIDGTPLNAEVAGWLAHGFNAEDGHRVTWLAAGSQWGELEGLADRVTVLHGQIDPVVPLAHAHRLARRAGADLIVVEGAGHHVDAVLRQALLATLHS